MCGISGEREVIYYFNWRVFPHSYRKFERAVKDGEEKKELNPIHVFDIR
jgi:hypothetical protein